MAGAGATAAGRRAVVTGASRGIGAATAIYQPALAYPLRRRQLTFEVNVHAPFDLAQGVVPGMVERGEGWIVNVSSAAAEPVPAELVAGGAMSSTRGVYGASKAALNRLTVAFAQELWGTGVRINTLAPQAAVLTQGAAALMGDTLDPELTEAVEATVEAVLLLCTAPAATTGGTHYSLDLLTATGTTVMRVDGQGPHPGGFRP